MKIMIMGGAGFVGSHLTEQWRSMGHDVIILDNGSRGQSNFIEGGEYKTTDCSIYEDVRKDLAHYQPDIVYNLAADVGGVFYNRANQNTIFRKNVDIALAAARACADEGVERYVYISSACVYAPSDTSHHENSLGGNPTPANIGYAMAKRCGEQVTAWNLGGRAIVVRPSNVYGPRDHFDERSHVIPALIKKFCGDEYVDVYGHKEIVRDFTYVTDTASGMIGVALEGTGGSVYNIGSGKRISLGLVVQAIRDVIDDPPYYKFLGGEEDADSVRVSDITRAREVLGYNPSLSLEAGIRRTYLWYKSLS